MGYAGVDSRCGSCVRACPPPVMGGATEGGAPPAAVCSSERSIAAAAGSGERSDMLSSSPSSLSIRLRRIARIAT